MSEKQLLTGLGKISNKQAINKTEEELEKYRKEQDKNHISDFDREVKKLMKESEGVKHDI